jgi:hypothetical protein
MGQGDMMNNLQLDGFDLLVIRLWTIFVLACNLAGIFLMTFAVCELIGDMRLGFALVIILAFNATVFATILAMFLTAVGMLDQINPFMSLGLTLKYKFLGNSRQAGVPCSK